MWDLPQTFLICANKPGRTGKISCQHFKLPRCFENHWVFPTPCHPVERYQDDSLEVSMAFFELRWGVIVYVIAKTGRSHHFIPESCSSSWWLNQPLWKYESKWESSQFSGENKKYLKPPPSRLLAGKLTCRPSKSMYGRCLSYGNGSLFGRHASFRGCYC